MQQIFQNHHQQSTSRNSPTTSKHSHPQKTSHNFKPKLQKSLNRIAAFCGKSRISLNENKTTELIITGRVHKYTKEYIPPLQIHNKPIPTTKHAKFLGVTFDQSLTFQKHINITATKAQTRAHQLYNIFNQHYGPSSSTIIRLYKIYIRPLFEYGSTATISATDNALAIWETNQTNYMKKSTKTPKYIKREHPEIRQRTNYKIPNQRSNAEMVHKHIHKRQYTNNRIHRHTDHRLPQNGQTRFTKRKNHPTHRRAKNFPEQSTREHDGIDNSPNSFLDENSIS